MKNSKQTLLEVSRDNILPQRILIVHDWCIAITLKYFICINSKVYIYIINVTNYHMKKMTVIKVYSTLFLPLLLLIVIVMYLMVLIFVMIIEIFYLKV